MAEVVEEPPALARLPTMLSNVRVLRRRWRLGMQQIQPLGQR